MLYEELGIKYEYYDPNPMPDNKERSDCTVRAYTKLLNKDWSTVYDDLAKSGKETGSIMNSDIAVKNYAVKNDLDYCDDFVGDNGMYLGEFLSKIKNKGITCMIATGSHVMYFSGNTIYDRNNPESERGVIDQASKQYLDAHFGEGVSYYIADDDNSDKILNILEGKVREPVKFEEEADDN